MKKEIHPEMRPVIFRDSTAGKDFYLYSTLTSKEKETVKGVEYFVIHLDISSASHPFFTGKQKLIDSSGRVEKFQKKMEALAKKKAGSSASVE